MPVCSRHARLLLVAVSSASLVACARGEAPADSAAAAGAPVSSAMPAPYLLTMSAVERMMDAQGRIAQAVRQDPSIEKVFADSTATLAQSAERLEQVPALKAALGAAGLTGREFLGIQMTWVQSTLASQMLHAGQPRDSVLRNLNASPANVEFVERNADAIRQAQEKAAAKYGK